MQPHDHKYIQGDIGELCDVCGLLRSTIEGVPTIKERIMVAGNNEVTNNEPFSDPDQRLHVYNMGKLKEVATILQELNDRLSALEPDEYRQAIINKLEE